MQKYFWLMPALVLSFAASIAAAENREVVINYEDPHGVALALAILPHSEQLPPWMQAEAKSGTGNNIGQIALTAGSDDGDGGQHTKYLFAFQSGDKSGGAAGTSELKLDLGRGQDVEVQLSSDALPDLPVCEPTPNPQLPCRISDLSRDLLAVELRHASNLAGNLRNLMTAHGLVMDDLAAKRILAVLDTGNSIQHVDFVGLVRGKDEILSAPDAASVFVVRLRRNGELSIVERNRDSNVGASDFKFSFEE
ncbi:MAG: hypothetical protein EOS21_31805 [Mesorhizobium sp.]|nr:MAG: hypothetical protein EOS21_31805 [Mesorhizobium sp.]